MWNMEGLVVIGFCEQDYVSLKNHMHIPFVVYDGYFKEQGKIGNLIIDNYDGGYQMGIYLRSLGHKKVCCISDNNICMDRERFEGFQAAMAEDGADFIKVPLEKKERRQFYQQNFKRFMAYSAIFAVSDYYAMELMQFLQEKEVKIPEEISIAGFDDSPLCEMVYPALTTICQNGRQRAKMAVDLLKELREGNDMDTTVTLPVTLVKRQSVKRNRTDN